MTRKNKQGRAGRPRQAPERAAGVDRRLGQQLGGAHRRRARPALLARRVAPHVPVSVYTSLCACTSAPRLPAAPPPPHTHTRSIRMLKHSQPPPLSLQDPHPALCPGRRGALHHRVSGLERGPHLDMHTTLPLPGFENYLPLVYNVSQRSLTHFVPPLRTQTNQKNLNTASGPALRRPASGASASTRAALRSRCAWAPRGSRSSARTWPRTSRSARAATTTWARSLRRCVRAAAGGWRRLGVAAPRSGRGMFVYQ
jgi:hypothetical protein